MMGLVNNELKWMWEEVAKTKCEGNSLESVGLWKTMKQLGYDTQLFYNTRSSPRI
jgi:hypothetical protein